MAEKSDHFIRLAALPELLGVDVGPAITAAAAARWRIDECCWVDVWKLGDEVVEVADGGDGFSMIGFCHCEETYL